MPRHIKEPKAVKKPSARKRTRTAKKKRPEAKARGADKKPVEKPRGGYAHKGQEAVRPPTMADLENVDLSVHYGAGETPEVVMYGRRLQVLTLMMQGEPTFNIVNYCERAFGMTETQTRYVVNDIRAAWRSDMEEQISFARAEAITRLRRDLSQMRTSQSRARWADINRHEKLLSQIEGTQQPVKVNVFDGNAVVRDAMAQILGTMTEEQFDSYVTYGYEIEKSKELPEAAE